MSCPEHYLFDTFIEQKDAIEGIDPAINNTCTLHPETVPRCELIPAIAWSRPLEFLYRYYHILYITDRYLDTEFAIYYYKGCY